VAAGSVILVLKGTYAGATTISKQLNIYGQGYSTVLDDNLTLDAVSNAQIQDIRLNSNLIFSASADNNSVFNLFVDPSFTVSDSGSDNTVVPVSGPLPAGTVLDFAGNDASAPLGFLFAFGQAVSRTTYSRLFAAIGTTHGVGDGSTTFNVPDLRGRVSAGRDDMGGVPALRITSAGSGISGISTGASGGVQNVTLTAAQSGVPAHTHPIADPGHFHSSFDGTNFLLAPGNNATSTVPGTGTGPSATNPTRTASAATGISGTNVNTAAAASAAHTNVQPTIILNKIIKV
jgi:microcystin-dependent protein